MSNFPAAFDGPATLYSPVDAFSNKSLETKATVAINAGDSTIAVQSTSGGFATTYGILSIDDELIVYGGKTTTQFSGCQRGAFGTTAASHQNGATVRANMVAGFLTALQSAVLAVENELGTAAARNYVRKDGAVTITGLKTFQDGAEFGAGTKAGTGLVRLPNAGGIKWRKADDSGDLGISLNAANHIAMDAVIDFAPGQTFGAFSYPDASTTQKGIVQVDATGGIVVNAGLLSLAATGVSAGAYTKVTVDTKGRVTAGASLLASDLPMHTHAPGDIVGVAGATQFQVGGTATVVSQFGRDNSGAFQSLVEIRTQQTLTGSGNEIGRGCIRLLDKVSDRELELGYYAYGAGIFTNQLLELWTKGVSIRDFDGSSDLFLAIRDKGDLKDLRLKHDGTNGILTTTGDTPGGVVIDPVGSVSIKGGGSIYFQRASIEAGGQPIAGANECVVQVLAGQQASSARVRLGYWTGSYNASHWEMRRNGSDAAFVIADTSSGGEGTTRFRITWNGEINIGAGVTIKPDDTTQKLIVDQSNPPRGIMASLTNAATSARTGAQLQFTQANLADWVIGQVPNVHAFAVWKDRHPGADGAELLRITSAGRLLLGTATDDGANLLQVNGAAAVTGSVLTVGASAGFRFAPRGGSGDYQWYADWGSAYLYDHNVGAVRMTVVNGNVIVGDTSDGGHRLDVNGTGRFRGTLRIAGAQAYLECGAFQTVGGAFENMAKYSEDFSVATWDKNGGSCSVTADNVVAPDGNQTADTITAVTATPIIHQQIAGLVSGGTHTFYVWARVPSGTRKCSLAIVDNDYASYLAGPTQITLTTSWQRFKITGTLGAGQTGLWVVVRQYASNGDDWTTGDVVCLWGACLQQGNDPRKGYARTWAFQTASVAAGIACGPMVVSAISSTDSPFKVRGPGSNLADHTLLEVTAGGELIIAGGTGNGYRLAEIMSASNPSGWSGVIKVKNPAGVTAGYILLHSNP